MNVPAQFRLNHNPLNEEHLRDSFESELYDLSTSVHNTLTSATKISTTNHKESPYSIRMGNIDHERIRACTNCAEEIDFIVPCGHRLCFQCAKVYLTQRRQYLVSRFTEILLKRDIKSHGLRLLTLTFKNVWDLDKWISKFQDWIKSFLRSFKINKKLANCTILGGCGNIEVTYNSEWDNWHIHVHLTIEGNYIPQKVIKQQWIKTTGGNGSIVDIRLIKNNDRTIVNSAWEIAKYNAKPHNIHEWTLPRIQQFEIAVHNKRLFFTFGTWYNDRIYDNGLKPCPNCGSIGTMLILDYVVPELIQFNKERALWDSNHLNLSDYG